MKKSLEKFWKIYSLFYDTLNYFYPYIQTLKVISSHIKNKKNGKCLDCGCGTGNLIRWINKEFKIVALDNNYAMLKRAVHKYERDKVSFVLADLEENLCFKDNQFDYIVSNNVLSYIKNLDLLLEECGRILKPDGEFIISVPHKRFNIFYLFILHLKKSTFFQTIKIIFPLIILGTLNIFIYFQVIKRNFYFFSREELIEKIGKKFIIKEITYSYGKQAILIIGRKYGNTT